MIIRNRNAIFLGMLATLAALVWYPVFYFESHAGLRVTFFDVGQGDSILATEEGSTQILVDGGPGDSVLAKLGRSMPFWDRTVEVVILTHPEKDHITGLLEVLQRYNVGFVLWTGVSHTTAEYQEWVRILEERRIPVILAHAGQRLIVSDMLSFDILSPSRALAGKPEKNLNETSIVGQLQYGERLILLTGDIGKPTERRLLFEAREKLDSDILKVGHHGSKNSSLPEFIELVSPNYAVIQVGRKNRYGHPTGEVLDKLAAVGAKVFRTDLDGDITFFSNGSVLERR